MYLQANHKCFTSRKSERTEYHWHLLLPKWSETSSLIKSSDRVSAASESLSSNVHIMSINQDQILVQSQELQCCWKMIGANISSCWCVNTTTYHTINIERSPAVYSSTLHYIYFWASLAQIFDICRTIFDTPPTPVWLTTTATWIITFCGKHCTQSSSKDVVFPDVIKIVDFFV